jgi:probable F420-dependent oxidoreductase
MLVAQREPIVTAKAVATLDRLSAGRVDLGVGFGWHFAEMAAQGVDPATRAARVREQVLMMRALWTSEIAAYDGDFVSLAPSWSWPKPEQLPLPVLLGGRPSPLVFRHIAEYGQGWIPAGAAGLGASVARLREEVARYGRDPQSIEIVPFTSIDTNADKVAHLAEIGASQCAFALPSGSADELLPILDRLGELIRSV